MRYRFFVVVRHNVVDGQAEEKDSFAPLLRQKENCTMLVRPSGRSVSRSPSPKIPIDSVGCSVPNLPE